MIIKKIFMILILITCSNVGFANSEILEKLSEYKNWYLLALDKIDYIIENEATYINPDIAYLKEMRKVVKSELYKLKLIQETCYIDEEKCSLPTTLNFPNIVFPNRISDAGDDLYTINDDEIFCDCDGE